MTRFKSLKIFSSLGWFIGILLIMFGVFIATDSVVAITELRAPSINVAPNVYYPLDEVLYIEGVAEPKIGVELFFERSGSQPTRLTIKANSNGEWFFGDHLELASGEWMVRARAVDETRVSDWSNPRIIRSHVSGFVIGALKVKYLPIVLTLLGLFVAAFTLLGYAFFRIRTIRRIELERKMNEKTEALLKELREQKRENILSEVEHDFSELRKNILDELEHLETAGREGKVSSNEESVHRDKLIRELREAKESLSKKIRDNS